MFQSSNPRAAKRKGAFGLLALTATIFILTQHDFKEHGRNLLWKHCEAINSDFTRPDNRHCVKPIKFDGGKFLFEIPNRDVEIYEVVRSADNDSKGYYYIYEGHQTRTQ